MPKKNENVDYLYDWVFHFNIYTNKWAAMRRDDYTEYWSDSNLPNIIRSSSFQTLLEILHKVQGDVSKINEKLNIKCAK